MKKIFSIFLVFSALLVVLTGCGKKETLDMSLEDILAKVYEGFGEDELPSLNNTQITKDNMAYYLGVDTIDFKEGLASEPIMSSIAHSVVVLRVADGVDIEKAKQEIRDNVNPAKWLCVEAEKVIVDNNDDVIILIMASNDTADKILNNFKNL